MSEREKAIERLRRAYQALLAQAQAAAKRGDRRNYARYMSEALERANTLQNGYGVALYD